MLLALALILMASTRAVLAQDHPDGSFIDPIQTINGVWGPGTITASSNVVINAGVVITVAPGTTIVIDGNYALTVNGELRVNGPVTFTHPSATPGSWQGVVYALGSRGYLDGATIEYAVHGLSLETINPIHVSNSTLRYNRHAPASGSLAFGAGLYIARGNHLIDGVNVYGNALIASGAEARGAGIYVASGDPQILGSWIYENTVQAASAQVSGGGIGIYQGGAIIQGCQVTTNTISGGSGNNLRSGAGIGIMDITNVVIRNNWIAGNEIDVTGYGGGGGIGFWADATALLIDSNVIANNRAWGSGWGEGGGIDAWERNAFIATNNLIYGNGTRNNGGGVNMNASTAAGDVHLINNTIVNNTAGSNGGVFRQSGGQVFNNIVYANTSGDIGGSSGSASNNLTTDPMFVGSGDLVEWYHIQAGSPARDAGTDAVANLPTIDYDGHPRPADSGWDIGFDEFILGPYINKSVEPVGAFAPGDPVTFILNFYNVGPLDVTNVVITDIVPTGLTGLSYASSGAALTPIPGQTYAWQVEDLAVGEGGVITISGIVDLDLFGQTFTNTAEIAAEAVGGGTLFHYEHKAIVNVCKTIQCMIDAAAPGDTVIVPAGIYTESLLLTKPVSVTGVSSTTVVVRAPANQRVLLVNDPSVTNDVVISNMTFENGSINANGGGVYLTNGAQPRFEDMIIANNRANNRGGGIYMDSAGATLIIKNSQFTGNRVTVNNADTRGAAIAVFGADARLTLENVTISNNTSERYGGAIAIEGNTGFAHLSITDSHINDNQATLYDGGAIFGSMAAITITHSTLDNNRAPAGDRMGGAVYLIGNSSSLTLNGSTLSNNQGFRQGGAVYANGSDIQINVLDGSVLTGNSTADNDNNAFGGAIYLFGNRAALTISASTVSTNTSVNYGGAIFIDGSSDTDRANLTITGSQINNNEATTYHGGGIWADQTLITITHSTLDNNRAPNATADRYGGAIYLTGNGVSLSVLTSTFTANTASAAGGAVYVSNNTAQVLVANSVISGNTTTRNSGYGGGGLYLGGNEIQVTILDTTLSGNTSERYGGALYVRGDYAAQVTIADSTIRDNEAVQLSGGGIYVYRAVTSIENTTIRDNRADAAGADGGGGYFEAAAATISNTHILSNTADDEGGGIRTTANLTLLGSTVANNTANDDGGGLYTNGGALTIANSTFSGNRAQTSADADGGAIYFGSASTANINNVTLFGNSASRNGGGIIRVAGTVNIKNTLNAGNTAAGVGANCSGAIANSPGSINNLSSDGSCPMASGFTIDPASALLGPLADNGGATWTHMLLLGNPAVNGGNNAVCAGAPVNGVDQRGVARPQGAVCDIGSVEVPASLEIAKSAANEGGPPLRPGERIDYTIVLTNGSALANTGVVITDAFPLHTQYVPGSLTISPPSAGGVMGAQPVLVENLTVAANSVVIIQYAVTVTLPLTDGTLIENTVWASSNELSIAVSSAVSDTVVATPAIRVIKTGPATADVGESIVLTFTVTNAGDTLLHNIVIYDDVVGSASLVSGDNGDGWLNLGEAWVYTAAYTIQLTDPDPLINTVWVTATDGPGTTVNDTDSHSTAIEYAPVLTISKTGPASAMVGDVVVYTLTVRHDAASDGSPVSGLSVNDTVAGAATHVGGDANSNSRLDAGEIWVYTAAYTIKPTDPDPLENVATVQGQDQDGDPVSAASGKHSLDIEFVPVIQIRKEGPVSARVGDTVTFYFFVTNDAVNGDGSPLTNVIVSDTVAGLATRIVGDATLDGGETWIFIAAYTIQSTDPSPLVNTGVVTAQDVDGDTVTDSDTHSTFLGGLAPVLALDKTGPAEALIGETVVYSFAVSHAAASDGSPVSNLAVNDNIAGAALYVGGDANGNGLLDLGETWVFTASYTIQASDPNPLVNTGVVSGQTGHGGAVSAQDTHSTRIEQQVVDRYTVYLPLVSKGATSGAAPDLVVTSVIVTENSIQIVIENQGGGPVESAFWVDLYVSPNPVPTGVNQIWSDGRSAQGAVWGIGGDVLPLVPGASLTLTYGDAYWKQSLSYINWPLVVGTPIYVQVDSANATTSFGAVLESHEIVGGAYNNIMGPTYVTPGMAGQETHPAKEHVFPWDSDLPLR